MTFVAEPVTVFAVVISTPQLEIALPWIIAASIVTGICWVLIAVDMRRPRPVALRTEQQKPVDQPQFPGR
jgi:hypothetical protein